MRLTSSLLGPLALVAITLSLAGCNLLPQQFCELGLECDEGLAGLLYDPVLGNSDDSAAVCAVNQETNLNAWRANREEHCHKVADAWEEWMACTVEEGCDAFRIDERECRRERERYDELVSHRKYRDCHD